MSDSTGRSAVLPTVLLAGVAGTFAWLVLRARRPQRPAVQGPPVGRVGEPGPQWSVVEKVPVARGAGEVAQHLHDHGGLPGLHGGRQGPAMDRITWDLPGSGHYEAEVHGLPGADHTELTVRVEPERAGVRGAAEHAAAAVLGTSARAQVRESLGRLAHLLETTEVGSPERAALADAASADPGQERGPRPGQRQLGSGH